MARRPAPSALGEAVAAAFDEGATYTDPLADVAGHEGLAAVIAGAQAQFPGFVFRPSGGVDGHHDIARFGWELVSAADGSAPVAGFDVVRLGEDGRIRSVLGYPGGGHCRGRGRDGGRGGRLCRPASWPSRPRPR